MRRLVLTAVVLSAPLLGCSDDPQLRAPAATAQATSEPPTSDGVTRVDLALAGGQVSGDTDVSVTINERVALTVTADVTGEVLVRPRGLLLPVTPQSPATANFVVDQLGPIEISLVGSDVLGRITVS